MSWSSNTYTGLQPMYKSTYGGTSEGTKPTKGVSLRVKPESVNKVPEAFRFNKLQNLIKPPKV